MLSPKSSAPPLAPNSFKLLARYFWNYNDKPVKIQDMTEDELASALNLISKPQKTHRPSLIKSVKHGPANEVYKNSISSLPSRKNQLISPEFVQSILYGIKSSNINYDINSISFHQLLNEMSPSEQRLYIRKISDEKVLFQILILLNSNKKLSLKLLTEIILNKCFIHLNECPINLFRVYFETDLNSIDAIKVHIILLKKFQDLKQPVSIIKNLKENFSKNYLPLIMEQELNSFYERIIWRFVFEYLFQYTELDYMKMVNKLRTSFIMWEASFKNNKTISNDILNFHKEDINPLQKIFFEIALLDDINLSSLKSLSVKYKIFSLNPDDRNNRNSCYAIFNELEKSLLEIEQTHLVTKMMEKLALYRVAYIQSMFDKSFIKKVESEHLVLDRF